MRGSEILDLGRWWMHVKSIENGSKRRISTPPPPVECELTAGMRIRRGEERIPEIVIPIADRQWHVRGRRQPHGHRVLGIYARPGGAIPPPLEGHDEVDAPARGVVMALRESREDAGFAPSRLASGVVIREDGDVSGSAEGVEDQGVVVVGGGGGRRRGMADVVGFRGIDRFDGLAGTQVGEGLVTDGRAGRVASGGGIRLGVCSGNYGLGW